MQTLHKHDEWVRSSSTRKFCHHPLAPSDCSSEIISAHTISRGSQLKPIASDGLVVICQVKNVFEANKSGRGPEFKYVGIKKASTFNGFCSKHDKELFSPVEDDRFEASDRQIALLHFRALSREYAGKKSLETVREHFLTSYPEPPNSYCIRHQSWLNRYEHVDAIATSASLGAGYIANEAHDVASYLFNQSVYPLYTTEFRFSSILPFAFSGNFTPSHTPDGDYLQNIFGDQNKIAGITIHTFTSDESTSIFFTCLKRHAEAVSRVVDFFSNSQGAVSSLLFEYALSCVENVFMNPCWFDSLTGREQDVIASWALRDSTSNTPTVGKHKFGEYVFDLPGTLL